MAAAADMAGLKYIVNVVINGKKEVLKAFAGDWRKAHEAGCAYLKELAAVQPARKGDIVITSNGGYPLDQNIYQAVKCMTAAEAAANEGAVIIALSYCEDGTGSEDFYEDLKRCESPGALYDELSSTPMDETRPDQWESQVLARVMDKHRVLFVCCDESRRFAQEMKLTTAPDLESAFKMAVEMKGSDAKVTVIPDGVSVIVETVSYQP